VDVTAARLLGYVLTPFAIMGNAVLAFLPNLIFLVVLVAVARYVLTLLSLVAADIERGTITFSGFEREWTGPTFRIIRIAVIGFTAVVAYPYIQGRRPSRASRSSSVSSSPSEPRPSSRMCWQATR
jgi:hypothetical protein